MYSSLYFVCCILTSLMILIISGHTNCISAHSFLVLSLSAIILLQVASNQADELKNSREEATKLQAEMSTLKTQRAQKGTVAHPSRDSSIKAHLPQPQVQH